MTTLAQYIVKPGDSVSGILKKLGSSAYGSRDSWEAVRNANNLNSSYVIRVGQVLNIPDNLVGNSAGSTTPGAPIANPGTSAGSTAPGAGGVGFGDLLSWDDYFSPELAKSAAAQRSARYYDPLVAESQQSIYGDYAGRGLSRSGGRAKTTMDMYRDMADEEAKMREQLYTTREGEAKTNYNLERSRWEENPTGYEAPTEKGNTSYDYQFPEESPRRYSRSYRDWLRKTYNI